jgi:dTDP-4-amino-4,6-dideoxygalactose transaminase
MSERVPIPVYRALLPRTPTIVPYLERMDAKRWYTNRGELVQLLEARLGERIGTPVMSAANGTVAIEAAILATAGRATAERPLALLPAYTFVATASAVEACGYRPYLLDVDETTWSLACSTLDHHPALASAGIVVPVSPYGRAIAQEPWAAFSKRTQIPVVIDAAAAFEALLAHRDSCTGTIPVTLSFQSTKAFSSGEGGAVVWSDEAGLKRIAQALNFGFLYKRESTSAGTNGKMSEYHAAVGLAALDAWESTCAANRAVADAYRTAAHAHGISERLFVAPDVASNYAIVDAGSATLAIELIAALNEELIESRLWYGSGLQAEPYWRDTESDALHITERIAPALVGLPMAPDLDSSAIARIVEIAARTLSLKLRQ